MNIPARIENEIRTRIESGRYDSTEDVLESAFNALSLVEEEENELRRNIQKGIDQMNRGETVSREEFLESIRKCRNELIDSSHS